MAAGREEGLLKFVAVNPEGGSKVLMGYVDTRETAPTGKIAEPDLWFKFPRAPVILDGSRGWKIQIIMKSEVTDILDNGTDTIIKVPAIINGILTTVGKAEFQMNTGAAFADPSVTANIDSVIGEWDIPAGTLVQMGGKKGWLEPYDDTA